MKLSLEILYVHLAKMSSIIVEGIVVGTYRVRAYDVDTTVHSFYSCSQGATNLYAITKCVRRIHCYMRRCLLLLNTSFKYSG